jgi:hypothetical protein
MILEYLVIIYNIIIILLQKVNNPVKKVVQLLIPHQDTQIIIKFQRIQQLAEIIFN